MNFMYHSIPQSVFNLPLAGWDYAIDHTLYLRTDTKVI